MSDSFQFEIQESSDGTVRLNLCGAIDESTELPGDFDFSNFKQVIFDFEKVNFINSGGTKAWIQFIENIHKLAPKVVFENCPALLVNQINTVAGFLPKNGQVDSVLVPVACKKCDRCFNIPLNVALVNSEFDELAGKVQPEDCDNFPRCRSFMEVDAVREYFFRFTNR